MAVKASIPGGATNADDVEALCEALLAVQTADEMMNMTNNLRR